MYQSQYTGGEIDESIGKVQDVFVKKTSILPVEIGGTGQTTIDGIKNMLGIGQGQDILPIANGGTGATTAADARTNLGVTPENIGAVSKAGDTMTGDLKTTGKFTIQHNSSGRSAELWTAAGTGATLVFYDSDTEGGGKRSLKLNGILGAENPNLDNAIQFAQTINGATQYHVVLTSANAASRIQSLLQRGSISVVKSVQRGTITIAGHQTEGSATLGTIVNTSKAVVLYGGQYNIQETSGKFNPVMLQLISANKVTATLYAMSAYSWQIPYQVIEYY